MSLCRSFDNRSLSPSIAALDPSGARLGLASGGRVQVLDARSGAALIDVRLDQGSRRGVLDVTGLGFSGDGKALLVAAVADLGAQERGELYRVSLESGEVTRIAAAGGAPIAALGVAPDGRVIVASADAVAIVDLRRDEATPVALPRHPRASPALPETSAILFSSDRLALVIAADHVYELDLDAAEAEVIAAIEPDSEDEERAGLGLGNLAALVQDALLVAERRVPGARGGRIFEVTDRGITPSATCDGALYALAASERARYLDERGYAHEQDLTTGEVRPLVSPWVASLPQGAQVQVVSASRDGQVVAVTTCDRPLELIIVADTQEPRELLG